MSSSRKVPKASGWHTYGYNKDGYPCAGADDDCGAESSPGHRPTNYYRCKNCRKISYFKSCIATFISDDISRAEAAKRMKSKEPLPVCTQMCKIHTEFRAAGGKIKRLTRPETLPTILWDETGRFIKGITYKPSSQ